MDLLIHIQLFALAVFAVLIEMKVQNQLKVRNENARFWGIRVFFYLIILEICLYINSLLYPKLNVIQLPKPNTNQTVVDTTHPTVHTPDGSVIMATANSLPDSNKGVGFARESDLKNTKYGIFTKKTNTGDMESNPFDNLEPNELMSRLNYIYYATANPYQMVSYGNYKTEMDKRIEKDKSSLSSGDEFFKQYNAKYYPQLSANLIDARDCLNEGNGSKSCFQTPQLFKNLKEVKEGFTSGEIKPTSILSQGIETLDKVFIKEGFSNPMVLDTDMRYLPTMFKNAPGDQDFPLDIVGNEYLRIDNSDKLCRHCKLAVCKDDVCFLQNSLFM
jgi:hypothetical protein